MTTTRSPTTDPMIFPGQIGDRVRLIAMPNDPNPVPEGSEGTVEGIVHLAWGHDVQAQIWIKWDNGRKLACICPPDHLEVIPAR